VNYKKELRMEIDIRRNGKIEKVMEFAERMKKVHEEAETALKKTQEEIKQQVNRERKKAEKYFIAHSNGSDTTNFYIIYLYIKLVVIL